jgi:hypothetical protein
MACTKSAAGSSQRMRGYVEFVVDPDIYRQVRSFKVAGRVLETIPP